MGARARAAEATAMWRELGDDLPLAVALALRGLIEWLLGNPTEAVDYLEESRRVFERCDRNPVTVAQATNALRDLGMVARSQGDYVRAAEYFRESVMQARLGMPTGGYNEARSLCHLGRTVFLQGDVAQAKQLFSDALGRHAGGATGRPCAGGLPRLAGSGRRRRGAAA